MISKAQLEAVFRFSMNIGRDFVGRWLNSKSLRITILNATKEPSSQLFHPPYVGFGGLTVSILESGFYVLSFFGLLTFFLPPPLLSIFSLSSASSALSGLWWSDRVYSGMRCNYSFFWSSSFLPSPSPSFISPLSIRPNVGFGGLTVCIQESGAIVLGPFVFLVSFAPFYCLELFLLLFRVVSSV